MRLTEFTVDVHLTKKGKPTTRTLIFKAENLKDAKYQLQNRVAMDFGNFEVKAYVIKNQFGIVLERIDY